MRLAPDKHFFVSSFDPGRPNDPVLIRLSHVGVRKILPFLTPEGVTAEFFAPGDANLALRLSVEVANDLACDIYDANVTEPEDETKPRIIRSKFLAAIQQHLDGYVSAYEEATGKTVGENANTEPQPA